MTDHARPPAERNIKFIWLGVGILVLLVMAGAIYLAVNGNAQKDDKETAQAGQVQQAQDKKDLAEEVQAVCKAGGAPAKKLNEEGLCTKTKEIIQEPIAGPTGNAGEDGKDGRDGKDGKDGQPGASPPCLLQANRCVGAIGADGPQGKQGLPGKDGQDGADGKDGATGPEGPEGPGGPQGEQGERGVAGPSAYQVAVQNGFVGTEEAWLSSLKGDKGDDGAPGTDTARLRCDAAGGEFQTLTVMTPPAGAGPGPTATINVCVIPQP